MRRVLIGPLPGRDIARTHSSSPRSDLPLHRRACETDHSLVESEVTLEPNQIGLSIHSGCRDRGGRLFIERATVTAGSDTDATEPTSGASGAGPPGRGLATGFATSPRMSVSKFCALWFELSGLYDRTRRREGISSDVADLCRNRPSKSEGLNGQDVYGVDTSAAGGFTGRESAAREQNAVEGVVLFGHDVNGIDSG